MLIPEVDVLHILERSRTDLECLRGKKIFLTGATGFFGKWLLGGLCEANLRLNLGLEILALSRDPEAFGKKFPELHGKAGEKAGIRWLKGNIENFEQPEGRWPWVLHAATPTDLRLYQSDPVGMARDILRGTERMLSFIDKAQSERVLFTSSGAVYGKFPPGMIHVPETHREAPSPGEPNSAYAEAKRMSEAWLALQAQTRQHHLLIARCFAFVGPHLPWDWHFAVGNFLRDAMSSTTIKIGGDGTPYRSYLYGADLVVWLLRIWTQGKSLAPYHVGSDAQINIKDLAHLIAKRAHLHWGRPPIEVAIAKQAEPGRLPDSYVPSVENTKRQLGLEVAVGLEVALDRTVAFHQSQDMRQPSG